LLGNEVKFIDSAIDTGLSTTGADDNTKARAWRNWGIGVGFNAISSGVSIAGAAASGAVSGAVSGVGGSVLSTLTSTAITYGSNYLIDVGKSFVYASLDAYDQGISYDEALSNQFKSRFTAGRFVSDAISTGVNVGIAAMASGISSGVMNAKYSSLGNNFNAATPAGKELSGISDVVSRAVGLGTSLFGDGLKYLAMCLEDI